MRLVDVVTSPWALVPEKLLEIRAIYETHLRGDKIDIKAIEAKLDKPLVNEPKAYQVVNGVAVVPLVGVLAKRANLFMQISGGTSTQLVSNWLAQAAADPAVHAIALEIDSPGGQVDGVQELAGRVQAIRAAGKPVVAWVSGIGASGAYWIASAAERVLIADGTTLTGSIGVVATHVDVSRREEQLGIRTSEITAGKYKRIASNYAPLSEEGRATIQAQVDAIYTVFVEDVAANRGVSVERVLSDMADGRVFVGVQGVEAGLVDGVSTLDALIADLAPRPGAGRSSHSPKKGASMDIEQLKTEHPDTFEAVRQQGVEAGMKDALASERTRIGAILAEAVPGHEALTAQSLKDGMTVEQYCLAVLRTEKGQRDKLAADLKEDAAGARVPDAPTPAGEKPTTRAELHAAALAYQAQHKTDYVTAFKAVGGQ